jgi:hypothetical protein
MPGNQGYCRLRVEIAFEPVSVLETLGHSNRTRQRIMLMRSQPAGIETLERWAQSVLGRNEGLPRKNAEITACKLGPSRRRADIWHCGGNSL